MLVIMLYMNDIILDRLCVDISIKVFMIDMYIYSFNAFIVQEDEWSITQAMQIQIYK